MDPLEQARSIVARSTSDLIDRSSSLWWQDCQEKALTWLRESASSREFIHHMQAGQSGFDQRAARDTCDEVEQLCRYKWAMLGRMFPGFESAIGSIDEHPRALPASIIELSGRRVSNVFLSHLALFLFIQKHCAPQRVLEIGGGYGSLARIFCSLSKSITYVIIDLPTSLLCAYVYLREALPEVEIELVQSPDNAREYAANGAPLIVLIPSGLASTQLLASFNFDLALNTGSFQEMPADICQHYQSLIFEDLRVPAVYSHNYFLSAGEAGSERAYFDKAVIPHFPTEYHAVEAVINNPVVDIDSSSRNWLEILLSRDRPRSPQKAENLTKIIEEICHIAEPSISSYLRAYAFVTRFYFGGELRTSYGRTRSNLLHIPGAWPEDFKSANTLRSWVNQNLTEIRVLRLGLNLDLQASDEIAKRECELIAQALTVVTQQAQDAGQEWSLAGRIFRKGLPSLTPFRASQYREALQSGFTIT